PVDLTFVNENDEVAYYSDTEDRIFPRSRGIIGRKVQKCHPPKSVDIVEDILEKFKSGEKRVAEFWIQAEGAFILIRYFAMQDENGKYIGTLEVSQELSRLRSLEGERRLVQWGD
ncbi:MAG: PAS domain-containing protein, partial [Candidatus Hermodarchaeota archaeon]